jgi:hypothetical protein
MLTRVRTTSSCSPRGVSLAVDAAGQLDKPTVVTQLVECRPGQALVRASGAVNDGGRTVVSRSMVDVVGIR